MEQFSFVQGSMVVDICIFCCYCLLGRFLGRRIALLLGISSRVLISATEEVSTRNDDNRSTPGEFDPPCVLLLAGLRASNSKLVGYGFAPRLGEGARFFGDVLRSRERSTSFRSIVWICSGGGRRCSRELWGLSDSICRRGDLGGEP